MQKGRRTPPRPARPHPITCTLSPVPGHTTHSSQHSRQVEARRHACARLLRCVRLPAGGLVVLRRVGPFLQALLETLPGPRGRAHQHLRGDACKMFVMWLLRGGTLRTTWAAARPAAVRERMQQRLIVRPSTGRRSPRWGAHPGSAPRRYGRGLSWCARKNASVHAPDFHPIATRTRRGRPPAGYGRCCRSRAGAPQPNQHFGTHAAHGVGRGRFAPLSSLDADWNATARCLALVEHTEHSAG
eukprot:308466-Chlamydomonas_euryale.AAC.11